MGINHPSKISAIADTSSVIYERRAGLSVLTDIPNMKKSENWKPRLEKAAAETGRSLRDISLKAGLAHGYLQSILKTDRDPTVDNLIAICNEINVSLSYVIFGFELSAESEEILTLIEKNPSLRDGILMILKTPQKP